MSERERIAALERRLLIALALERVGGLSSAEVDGAARELLDALMAGDDPLSDLLRGHLGPVIRVNITKTAESPNA